MMTFWRYNDVIITSCVRWGVTITNHCLCKYYGVNTSSEITCSVIGRAQHGLTPSKRQKNGPGLFCTLGLLNSDVLLGLPS